MLVIPAIDLKGGKCVRLWQGIKNRETIYAGDPVQVAKFWFNRGARRLHIVDLDGAFRGNPQHVRVAEQIKKSLPVLIQYGGGIRTLKVLEEVKEKGIDFAIIGTKALSKKFVQRALEKFGQKIIISIDYREGRLALKGWEEEITVGVQELIRDLTKMGIKTIILTDITRDGTLKGVNIKLIQDFLDFLRNVNCKVFIAGGISSIEDIKRINELRDKKIKGVIIGRALYTGAIRLEKALKITNQVSFPKNKIRRLPGYP